MKHGTLVILELFLFQAPALLSSAMSELHMKLFNSLANILYLLGLAGSSMPRVHAFTLNSSSLTQM